MIAGAYAQHFSLSPENGCGSAEVSFTNLHPANGYSPVMFITTGFTYSWDFGNGNTSTLENPDSQIYNTLGEHNVNYTVTIDTIGFELTKIVLDGYLGCNDPFTDPDVEVYIIIKDNNGNELYNTESSSDSYSVDPESNSHLEYSMGALNIGTDIPLWLEIWDADPIDSDDNCIDDGEGNGTMIAMQLPANNSTGFFETTKVYTTSTPNGLLTITAYFNKPVIVLSQTIPVNVYPLPGAPGVDQSNLQICNGEAMPTISATGTNINWYDNADLLTPVYSGNNFTPSLISPDSTYTFYLTQTEAINSCTSLPATVTIDYNTIPTPEFENYSSSFCFGEIMPDFTANGSNIKWYSDESLTDLLYAGETFSNDNNTVGTYTLYVTQSNDAGTCTSEAAVLGYEIISGVDAEIVTTDLTCYGTSTGSATANVTQGQEPFTYIWLNGSNSQSMTGVPEGEYTVTIRDNNFCLAVFDAVISSPEEIEIITTVTSGFCPDDETGRIIASANGGISPYTYLWSDGSTGDFIENLQEGTYYLTVKDANLCEKTTSETISKNAEFNVEAVTKKESCPLNSDGSLSVSISGGLEPYTCSWSNGGNDTLISGLQAGNYTLTVTDFLGCLYEKSFTIENTYNICLVPASVFTPNNDGKNDTWKILFIEMHPQASVMVFSRTGQLVFETTGYNSDWNGSSNGKNLPSGSYMYLIDMKDGSEAMRGYVDIIR